MILTSFRFRNRNRGFTVAEMLVSIAILSVILTIVLLGQNTYTEGASLANTADNISFSITQAQVYGTSVREAGTGTRVFNAAYGLSIGRSDSSFGNGYVLFADIDKDKEYSSDWSCPTESGSECIEKTPLTSKNKITEICYIRNNNTEVCNASRVDITFIRPETDATFTFFNAGENRFSTPNIKGTKITIISPNGLTRIIRVFVTGQISVQ